MQQISDIYNSGISVIPVRANKLPIGSWKQNQIELIDPAKNENFTDADGYGIVCGKVSGNIECIDIDTKYDLTGTLFNDYKKLIHENAPELLKKLVVQQTPTGGYHFIYKCKTIAGNLKLAQRPCIPSELEQGQKQGRRVLVETRGEGGYFMCYPGYKVVYGQLTKINEITEQERAILFTCANLFNEINDVVLDSKQDYKESSFDLSPFEDYNSRADIVDLLESNGWTKVNTIGENIHFLRPGGTQANSATYHTTKGVFYVFTTSTEFDSNKGYNKVQVYTILNHNGDYSAASKALYLAGYGQRSTRLPDKQGKQSTLPEGDLDLSDFIEDDDMLDEYLIKVLSDSLPMGMKTGILQLDEYFRYKLKSFVIINGMDNVGKTTVFLYLSVLSSMINGLKWVILTNENNNGFVKRKLMEFHAGAPLKSLSKETYQDTKTFIEKHYTFLKNEEIYSYDELERIMDKVVEKYKPFGIFIDPYNSLDRTTDNHHEYDYLVASKMRRFIKKTNTSIYLNTHVVTEALRRTYPKKHEFENHAMPPGKADTEGGGKFANKADDFLTFHRMTGHPKLWNVTEIYVRKIKEVETGGKPTLIDSPIRLKMNSNQCGYTICSYNKQTDELTEYVDPIQEFRNPKPQDFGTIKPNYNFIEPIKEQEEDYNPF